MHIYLDVIILLNTLINGMILYLTGWAVGIKRSIRRLIIATGVSVAYVLIGLTANCPALHHPLVKFLFSALLIWIAYPFRSRRSFIKRLAAFYLISFTLGGVVLGFFFANSPADLRGAALPVQIDIYVLGAGLGAGIALVYFFIRPILRRGEKVQFIYPVTIELAGRQARANGFLDSGNHLYTLGGAHPVILIEKEAAKPLLSREANAYLSSVAPDNWIRAISSCKDEQWKKRIHLISYRAVGGSGLMLGFRADAVEISLGAKERRGFPCVVGIYHEKLSADGSYHILLHSSIVQCLGERG